MRKYCFDMPLKIASEPAAAFGSVPIIPWKIGDFTVSSDLRHLVPDIGPPPYNFRKGVILGVLERPNDLLVTIEGYL